MRIAAAYLGAGRKIRKKSGVFVGNLEHVPVARFKRRKSVLEEFEILNPTDAGETGKNVIRAVKEITLLEVYAERFEIVPSALEFKMVAFCDIVNTDMQFAAAGKAASDFLAEKEVRTRA